MYELAQRFPDQEVLLRLEPEELGAKLLFLLRKRTFQRNIFMPSQLSAELWPQSYKEHVDLESRLVHIPDSKTPSGEGDMPMTEPAWQAFKEQIEQSPGSDYLFPSPRKTGKKPHITNLRKAWTATLKRASVSYFSLYELRHTFATRLSAGGVADHFVSQMLRQGDPGVFKRYSQAKLNMMRESLARLDRKANEHGRTSGTPEPS